MNINIKKAERSSVGKLKIYILGGICGVLAIVSIFLTIEVATSGVEVAKLEKTESVLDQQHRSFEESLVKNLSNSELLAKSEDLGFVKPTNLVYVSEAPTVAQLP